MGGGYSRVMFERCGFDYSCLDAMPGGLEIDLNEDRVPLAHLFKYQLVTNFGATKHVANQANAFRIIHDLTKSRGLMVHNLPMQGNIDHGLILYTPKFFDRLASHNKYERIMFKSGPVEQKPMPAHLGSFIDNFEVIENVSLPYLALHILLRKGEYSPFRTPFDGEIDKMSDKWRAKYG